MSEMLNIEELQNSGPLAGALGEDDLSLAGLAEIELDDIAEVDGFEVLPVAKYLFECNNLKLERVGDDNVPVLKVGMKIVEASDFVALPEGKTEEDYEGKAHTESFWFKDADSIGRFRVFLKRAGLDNTGKLLEAANRLYEHRFLARVTHNKSNKDPSRVYANLRVEGPASE